MLISCAAPKYTHNKRISVPETDTEITKVQLPIKSFNDVEIDTLVLYFRCPCRVFKLVENDSKLQKQQ